jgi:uncharacterized membrane protein (UPF0127 family)
MLFVYPENQYASMWMKNTSIPLDVAFISEKGVITDITSMQPHSLKPVGSSAKVRYALEMNQGWFDAQKIKVGDGVKINGG